MTTSRAGGQAPDPVGSAHELRNDHHIADGRVAVGVLIEARDQRLGTICNSAEALQKAHPEAKWLATRRDDGWAVARIDVPAATNAPTGTTSTPEPAAPREDPYSALDRITRNYGFMG